MSEVTINRIDSKQSSKTGTVESFGGKAKFVDVSPEHLVSDVPVLVAGGWSVGTSASKEVGREINKHGRRAIMVDHARFGQVPESDIHPQEVLHGANTLLEVLEAADVDRADVIAHSKGALDAVAAATMNPERFRSLILVAPAGMIGEDTFFRLGKGFARKMGRSITRDLVENPKVALTIVPSSTPYIAKNPPKSAREISAIVSTTVDQALYDLKESGIQIAVIQSNADPVFPPERIKKHVDLDEKRGNVDAYASVAWKKAGHDDLLIHPERTARAALQMIEQFESRQ